MAKKIDLRIVVYAIVGLADEAIILVVLLLVLSWLGVDMPIWLIIILSLVFLTLSFVVYRAFKKEPLLGFENMVGKKGIAVGSISPKGTVRIGNELWSAEGDNNEINNGEEIIVVGQMGLKLKVKETKSRTLH